MSDDPRVGTLFAGYRLEAVLGRRGTGVVFLAEDVRLNRRVVLRLLTAELTADERFRERFLRESQLVASLDHPNIVPVYEVGEAEGRLYVAMGQVEGADLASLLAREGRLEPERAFLIVTQLAEALDAARWSRGLAHGGLTPSNVLVAPAADATTSEHVSLLGFGLRPAEVGQHGGDVHYLAPEQIEGRFVSPRTDVYALGCVLFECLTGKPPFRRDSPKALLRAHLHEQPPSAKHCCSDVPVGIDRVIQKAMAKWPEERYSTCVELAAAAQEAFALGSEPSVRAPVDKRLSPVALPTHAEPAAAEEMSPHGCTRARQPRPAYRRIGSGREDGSPSQPSASSLFSSPLQPAPSG